MATDAAFYGQINKGKIGEQAIQCYFEEQLGWQCWDVSNIKEYQAVDTDLIVQNQNGQKSSFEIKTDYKSKDTGNMYVETKSNVKLQNPGWIYNTKAQFLCYCVMGSGLQLKSGCYVFKIDDIRQYIKQNQLTERITWNYKDKKYIAGYLISINDLCFELNHRIIDLPELI